MPIPKSVSKTLAVLDEFRLTGFQHDIRGERKHTVL